MSGSSSSVTQTWRETLKTTGYEHSCRNKEEFHQLQQLPFVWRVILKRTRLKPAAALFELGCGGGIYLASLALQGFVTHGIDASSEVIVRAQSFLQEVGQWQPIQATCGVADIFDYVPTHSYDMCFHFGVVEHFLEAKDRLAIWQKLAAMTKPGGWVVSVVPCGAHFMRKLIREKKLGGYNVPEMDYDCRLHREEFLQAGLTRVRCIPHNYFAFLHMHPHPFVSKILYPFLFLSSQVLSFLPMPGCLKQKAANTLIVLGQKRRA
ncbi:MAG: class I SAM-dependent methyltransferase [bacterium]